MRRFLLTSLIILAVLAILFIGAGTGLAEVGPFHPGQTLFPLQHFAEQQRARLIGSPTQQAHFYLDLLARRSDELSASTGSPTETAALVALNEALDQAVVAIGNAPEAGLEQIKIRLAGLVVKIEAALAGLNRAPTEEPVLYAEMQAEISSLRNMVGAFLTAQASSTESESQEAANPTPDPAASTPVEGTPLAVAFPEGSGGAQHAFFPLTGKHATLTCTSCHINGVYAGTPNQCAICHEKWISAEHYPGDCATCHIPTSFKDIQFDHLLAEATNCIGCHDRVKPLNHFSGLCSACHNTQAWKPANFNHQVANATNCQSCHTNNRPANHYTGQCSSCHNTPPGARQTSTTRPPTPPTASPATPTTGQPTITQGSAQTATLPTAGKGRVSTTVARQTANRATPAIGLQTISAVNVRAVTQRTAGKAPTSAMMA